MWPSLVVFPPELTLTVGAADNSTVLWIMAFIFMTLDEYIFSRRTTFQQI